MNNIITVNIENQLREAMAIGFDDGFSAGILRAVEILKQTTEEHSHNHHIEASNSSQIEETIQILKAEPITRKAHRKHSWKEWLEPFAKALINNTYSKVELINLGSKKGLTEAAINKQAYNLGFTCKHKDTHYTKTHSTKTYKLELLVQKVISNGNDK